MRKANPPNLSSSPLLVSRRDAADALGGVSVATLIRLEKQGVLKPVRLNKNSSTAQVFYRGEDINALAKRGD